MKKCKDCGETKPLSSFRGRSRSPDGRCRFCKDCEKERGEKNRARPRGYSRHYHLIQRYGIGAAEVDELIKQQGGVCAICEDQPATQVDHDGKTGEIRGVLCDGCNGGLSAFEEDDELLERAAQYLERHGK